MVRISNPRQTVLVTCRGNVAEKFSNRKSEKDNIITLDWHMPLSFEPEMFAISVGKTRYSLDIIRDSRVFVVNFMPFHLQKEVLFCGRNSGEHTDKFEKCNFIKEEAEKIDCPIIKEASAYFECEVVNEIETGDHILFIAKIVASQEKDKEKRIFHTIDDNFTTTKD